MPWVLITAILIIVILVGFIFYLSYTGYWSDPSKRSSSPSKRRGRGSPKKTPPPDQDSGNHKSESQTSSKRRSWAPAKGVKGGRGSPERADLKYVSTGPYFRSGEHSQRRASQSRSLPEMYEAEECMTCLSLTTGHPMTVRGRGFSGILAQLRSTSGTSERCKINISTQYENPPETMAAIRQLIEDKTPEIITIDNIPHVLQPCILKGTSLFGYFRLLSEEGYIRIFKNYCILIGKGQRIGQDQRHRVESYFTLENVRYDKDRVIGTLVCYSGLHERGWLDSKMMWHAGIPRVGSLEVTIRDGSMTLENGKPLLFVGKNDYRVDSKAFHVEMISDLKEFLKSRADSQIQENTKSNTQSGFQDFQNSGSSRIQFDDLLSGF